LPARGIADGLELTAAPRSVRAEALMHWVRVSFSKTTEMRTRPNGELQPARTTNQTRAPRDVIGPAVYALRRRIGPETVLRYRLRPSGRPQNSPVGGGP